MNFQKEDVETLSYEGLWKAEPSAVYYSNILKRNDLPDNFVLLAKINRYYHREEGAPFLVFTCVDPASMFNKVFTFDNDCLKSCDGNCVGQMEEIIKGIRNLAIEVVENETSITNIRSARQIIKECERLLKFVIVK